MSREVCDLLSCPFCGGKKNLGERICGPSCWIECSYCECRGPDEDFYDEDDGIKIGYSWNNRVGNCISHSFDKNLVCIRCGHKPDRLTLKLPKQKKENVVNIEMTGILIDRKYNSCCEKDCTQGADTAVYLLHPGREQVNVCLLHLKSKLEKGEWKISTCEKEASDTDKKTEIKFKTKDEIFQPDRISGTKKRFPIPIKKQKEKEISETDKKTEIKFKTKDGIFQPDRISGKKKDLKKAGIKVLGNKAHKSSVWDYECADVKIPDKTFSVFIDYCEGDEVCDIIFDNFSFGYVEFDDFIIVSGYNPFLKK